MKKIVTFAVALCAAMSCGAITIDEAFEAITAVNGMDTLDMPADALRVAGLTSGRVSGSREEDPAVVEQVRQIMQTIDGEPYSTSTAGTTESVYYVTDNGNGTSQVLFLAFGGDKVAVVDAFGPNAAVRRMAQP